LFHFFKKTKTKIKKIKKQKISAKSIQNGATKIVNFYLVEERNLIVPTSL